MFLNQLSLSERTAFINLSILAAKANETISEREYLILEDYCKETGVVFVDTATIPSIGEIPPARGILLHQCCEATGKHHR